MDIATARIFRLWALTFCLISLVLTLAPISSSVVRERSTILEDPCAAPLIHPAPSMYKTTVWNSLPIAIVTPSSTQVPLYERVVLSARESCDPDGIIVDHRWSFGRSATLYGPDVTLMFTESGFQTVVLTVMDDDGGTDSTDVSIEVLPKKEEPVLILSAGPDNMFEIVGGNEGTIVLDLVAYNRPASNIAVEIVDDGGLDVSVENIPEKLKPGSPAELCVRIRTSNVVDEATGSVILLRVTSDSGVSNIERLDVMIQPSSSSESLIRDFIEWLAVIIGFTVIYFVVGAWRKKR